MATAKLCDRCRLEILDTTPSRLELEVPLGAGELGQLVPMRLTGTKLLVRIVPNAYQMPPADRWRPIDLCLVCQLAVLEHAYRQAQGAITPIRRFVEHPPAPTFVVHILRAGWTYCGWDEEPHHWPSDHRWVEESHADAATCSGCLEMLRVKREKGVADG